MVYNWLDNPRSSLVHSSQSVKFYNMGLVLLWYVRADSVRAPRATNDTAHEMPWHPSTVGPTCLTKWHNHTAGTLIHGCLQTHLLQALSALL